MKNKSQKRLEAIERMLPQPFAHWSALIAQLKNTSVADCTLNLDELRHDLDEIDRLFCQCIKDGCPPSMWVLRRHISTNDVYNIVERMRVSLICTSNSRDYFRKNPGADGRAVQTLTEAHTFISQTLPEIDRQTSYPEYAWRRYH